MDIGSRNQGVAGQLSNFAPHPFVFDGVPCSSMEGFLQSLKFKTPKIQRQVCLLVRFSAKRRGSKQNWRWQKTQTLWWKGVPYDRHGQEYQDLLDRAFAALAKNQAFLACLILTMDETLIHSIGESDPYRTCLTEYEFCSRLEKIRSQALVV